MAKQVGERLALSIRQPYVEQILRRTKRIEYRSIPTRRIDTPFYLYAARTPGPVEVFEALGLVPGDLPVGVILGTAVITSCVETGRKRYEWHLDRVERLPEPLRPARRAQPVWFRPF